MTLTLERAAGNATHMKMVLAARASAILYDLLLARGDDRMWLLPANVCPIVPLVFQKAGVPFEFVDISADSLHLDLDQAQTLLSQSRGAYGGLLYVHSYGDPFTPNTAFAELKRQNADLLIIDDRCLCVPDFEPASSAAADVILYSTGYAKVVDLGFGGFAFLRQDVLHRHYSLPFQQRDLLRAEQDYQHSIETRSPHPFSDSNWLETDADLPSWNRYAERVRNSLKISLLQRQHINAVYDAYIPLELRLPPSYQLWRYNLRVKDNQKTLAAIFAGGMFASAHYASLVGIFGRGDGAQAADLAGHVINLFNDHHFSPEMAEKTAHIVLGSL